MKNTDKELEKAANRMFKGKAPESKKPTPKGRDGKYITAKDPKDAMGWLRRHTLIMTLLMAHRK